mgnify:FL=1|jgi:hypothetical protein
MANTNFTTGQVFTAAQANAFPRGVMATQTLTTNFATTAPNTTAQDSGMTLTFTEVSGRTYRITAYTNFYPSGGLQAITFRLLRAGVQVRKFDISPNVLDTSFSFPQSLTFIYTSAASGSITFKTTINATTTNTVVNDYGDATYFRQFTIEDIGIA